MLAAAFRRVSLPAASIAPILNATLLQGPAMKEVQLREAQATLSALVDDAARGNTSIITRDGKPTAVLLGIDEWNRVRQVPSFGSLLGSAPLEPDDLDPRDPTPLRDPDL